MVNNASLNPITSQLGLSQATNKVGEKTLGQDDFLRILVTQLQHQDPFDPQDNGEFIAQMASFGTVEGIGKLQQSFSNLSQSLYSNQALQASALVGRTVEVPSNQVHLDKPSGVSGSVEYEINMNQVEMVVRDSTGKTIKSINLGNQTEGHQDFHWDGTDDAGNTMPAGNYYIQITGDYNGSRLACKTLARANVNSVTLGQQGRQLSLNLQGLGDVNFSDVYRIT